MICVKKACSNISCSGPWPFKHLLIWESEPPVQQRHGIASCTKNKALRVLSLNTVEGFDINSMHKTGWWRKMFTTRANAASLMSTCSAHFQLLFWCKWGGVFASLIALLKGWRVYCFLFMTIYLYCCSELWPWLSYCCSRNLPEALVRREASIVARVLCVMYIIWCSYSWGYLFCYFVQRGQPFVDLKRGRASMLLWGIVLSPC